MAEARQVIDEAIHICPTDPAFYCNRANLHAASHAYSDMHADFSQALKLDTGLTAAALGQAIALRKQAQFDAARAALMQVSEAAQDFDWLCEWVLLQAVNVPSADLRGLLQPYHLSGEQFRDLADYLAEEGYADPATPLYEACLDLNPQDLTAQHMLASIRGDQSDRAPADYVTSLYDRCAAEFEHRLISTLGYSAPTLAVDWLQQLQRIPANQVLDLGCGTGLMGSALQARSGFKTLVGIDLSDNMLSLAAGKRCYSELIHADILSWNTTQRFDLICAMDLLIYLGNLKPLLAKVADWLTPNGDFICTLELSADPAPRLQASGRFQHSLQYLIDTATEQGLSLAAQQRFPLRREGNSTLNGAMLVLRKEALHERSYPL